MARPPININPNTTQIDLSISNNIVTVVDKTLPNNVDILQPTIEVVEVLTGPIGKTGTFSTSGPINFTGSFNISGSLSITGSVASTEGFTGSFLGDLTGTASYIEFNNVGNLLLFSSSISNDIKALEIESGSIRGDFNLFTSSYQSDSSSFDSRIILNSSSISLLSSSYLSDSASFTIQINANFNEINALSSSFTTFTASYNTGSFSGSFIGDGSQLTGIVSSKWSGSNPITRESDVEITGSLSVSGSTSLTGPINTDVLGINADELIMTGSFQLSGSMEVIGLITGTSSFSLTSSYIDGGFF